MWIKQILPQWPDKPAARSPSVPVYQLVQREKTLLTLLVCIYMSLELGLFWWSLSIINIGWKIILFLKIDWIKERDGWLFNWLLVIKAVSVFHSWFTAHKVCEVWVMASLRWNSLPLWEIIDCSSTWFNGCIFAQAWCTLAQALACDRALPVDVVDIIMPVLRGGGGGLSHYIQAV